MELAAPPCASPAPGGAAGWTERSTTMVSLARRIRHAEDPAPVAAVDLAPLVSLRQAVRHFWPALRPYRRWLLLTLVVVACGPAVETAKIWLSKLVIDE